MREIRKRKYLAKVSSRDVTFEEGIIAFIKTALLSLS